MEHRASTPGVQGAPHMGQPGPGASCALCVLARRERRLPVDHSRLLCAQCFDAYLLTFCGN